MEEKQMKKLFRSAVGCSIALPVVVLTHCLSLFGGRDSSVKTVGPYLTSLARQSLKFWVPKISDASQFHLFSPKMRANLKLWRPFFDVKVEEDTEDTFRVRVDNCPFCESFIRLGMPELAPYVCEGDWEKARRNAARWEFERTHQIGTGDDFCDHTYKRKKTGNP